MRFPNLLASLRDEKGLSIMSLAEALGMDSATYIEIELGRKKPDFGISERLEDFFGVPVDDLLLPTPRKRSLWQLMEPSILE